MPSQHGKIDEEFISFVAGAYDKVVPPEQFVDMRRVFFAGARAAITYVDSAPNENTHFQRMMELDIELNNFLNDLRLGRT